MSVMNDPKAINEKWVRNSVLYSVHDFSVEIPEETLNQLTEEICKKLEDYVQSLIIEASDEAAEALCMQATYKK